MKKRCLILFGVLLLSFVFCSCLVNAQTKTQNQFGYVNVAEVVLLHPTMKYFDPVSKRFRLEAVMKGEDAEKKAEENKVKFFKELSKLEEELKELESKRIEVDETYYERSGHATLSDEKLKSLSKKEKEVYNEKMAKMAAQYHNDANQARNKVFFAKEKLDSYKKSSIYIEYSTVGETDQLFSLILDDVYDAMNALAKKNNLSFVFNSSSEMVNFRTERLTQANPMPEFFSNLKEKLKESDGKKITGAYLNAWLDQKNVAFGNCMDKRLGNFVMLGGLDLTPEVITYIYDKHKIGNEQKDFIKEYYQKIVNVK